RQRPRWRRLRRGVTDVGQHGPPEGTWVGAPGPAGGSTVPGGTLEGSPDATAPSARAGAAGRAGGWAGPGHPGVVAAATPPATSVTTASAISPAARRDPRPTVTSTRRGIYPI